MQDPHVNVPDYDALLGRADAPPGSSWHVFGKGDQLGMLNFLTPERARAAAGLVRTGKSFNLDYPLNTFVPSSVSGTRPATQHHIFSNNPNHRDDWLDSFYLQSTSQVDSLRHIRHPEAGFYGGVADEAIDTETPALGIQLLAEKAIVGRGVLLDAVRYFQSVDDPIDPSVTRRLTPADLDAIAAAQQVEVRSGDIVLLYLGWSEYWLSLSPARRLERRQGSPGITQSVDTLRWIWNHQIAMFAADNGGLESGPVDPDSGFVIPGEPPPQRGPSHNGMLHRPLIGLLGMIIGELWKLDDLAADCAQDHVYEFLITVSPINVIGGVGSPPNAIAVK